MTSTSPRLEILVARNLPISNTGKVTLVVRPVLPSEGGAVIDTVVEVDRSALLVPGEYNVYPAIHFPKLPVTTGPGPVVLPLAHISYDSNLHSFSIKVNTETAIISRGQFSVLVNLTDLLEK